MFSLHDILFDIALPCGISLVVLLLGKLFFLRQIDPFNRWVPPLALALGVAVGEGFVFLWPTFPPPSVMDYLAFAGMISIPAALVVALMQRWFTIRTAIAVALMAMLIWLLLGKLNDDTWTSTQRWAWIGKSVGIAVLFWWLLDGLAGRSTGLGLPLVLMLAASASAIVLMLSDSLKMGLAMASLAAAMGPLFLVACWSRLFSIGRAGALVFALMYSGLLIAANFFLPDFPLRTPLILLGAPLLAWVEHLPGINRLSTPWRVTLQLILVGAALACAVVPAAIAFKQANAGGE